MKPYALTFKYGGLKNINMQNQIISLPCSWVIRLYEDFFHEWKVNTIETCTTILWITF